MSINKLYDSFDKAVADVFDGAVILIGGFGPADGCPSYLIRALYRQGAKNLTLVSNGPGRGRPAPGAPPPPGPRRSPPNYDDGGLLIQNGQVIKCVCAFPGHGRPGMMSAFHQLLAEGKMAVELVPQGTLAERIRAAKAGIPAFYTPTGAGTVIEKGKETRMIDGKMHVLEHALKADFALVRANKADRWGNLVYQGTSRNFNGAMAGAAKVTIAEVNEMVALGELNPEGIATPSIYVNRICSRKDSREEGA
ncbi:MAG: 3-oxoacid CoA-transferase subunit A [Chloroflexota bacterium]